LPIGKKTGIPVIGAAKVSTMMVLDTVSAQPILSIFTYLIVPGPVILAVAVPVDETVTLLPTADQTPPACIVENDRLDP
jgi:hypothetical protein